jgi:FkbM family methyltransferase
MLARDLDVDRLEKAPEANVQLEEITLSPGITIGEGWHGIELAADSGRPFRWTSARSSLVVDLGGGTIAEDVNLMFYLGSPEAHGERQITIIGPEGTVCEGIRTGWHYYTFPVRELLGQPYERQKAVSIEVSEPVHAPGDRRALGVMVTQVTFGIGEHRSLAVTEPEPTQTTHHRVDICLSPAVAIGEGWYGLEQAIDDGRSFRWSSARSFLRVDRGSEAVHEEGSVVLHLGSPAGDAPRQIAMSGPRGTAHQTIRSGWDYYAFPLQQIIGELRAPSVDISIEVSEPFHAPGDARDLGVMVDQIMLEDDGRHLPFILVEGLVASVKKHEVNRTELKICDYAQSTAPDIIVGELRSDEYQLGAIDFQPGDVVIDIGGHIGIFSCYLAKKYPFLKILAFEPIPVSHRMFRRNLTLNEIRNIRLYNLAVTSDRRELDMVVHLQGNTGGATANLGDLDLEGHARFRCSSLTLDDIFQSFLIDSCKLLKIDCEGSEHEILLTARCLDRVQYLRGEFHINQHLRGQGYSIERLAQHCQRLIKPERVVFTSCQMFE